MNEKQQLWYLINGLLNSDYTIETFVRKTYFIVHIRKTTGRLCITNYKHIDVRIVNAIIWLKRHLIRMCLIKILINWMLTLKWLIRNAVYW